MPSNSHSAMGGFGAVTGVKVIGYAVVGVMGHSVEGNVIHVPTSRWNQRSVGRGRWMLVLVQCSGYVR